MSLPTPPLRNSFNGEQPTNYMSLHPVEDTGVKLLLVSMLLVFCFPCAPAERLAAHPVMLLHLGKSHQLAPVALARSALAADREHARPATFVRVRIILSLRSAVCWCYQRVVVLQDGQCK